MVIRFVDNFLHTLFRAHLYFGIILIFYLSSSVKDYELKQNSNVYMLINENKDIEPLSVKSLIENSNNFVFSPGVLFKYD